MKCGKGKLTVATASPPTGGGVAVQAASAIATVRSRLRLRDRIVGSACEDCGISGCCAMCALLQMARHEGWDKRGAKYALCAPAGVPDARARELRV